LKQVFTRCKQENRAALVGYLTAGDPDVATSQACLLALASKVDVLEIGMPFSDPMADGPVIEAASVRALAAGTKMKDVFAMAALVRKTYPEIGIVLMGYANVAYALGFEYFAEQAEQAGVDGVLLVDIPAEENAICAEAFAAHGLSQIMLLAPTSSEERVQLAAKVANGFIYYVSLAGVTGAEMGAVEHIKASLSVIRKHSDLPICVGFGVKTTTQAAEIAKFADGVVVGSHFVSQITANQGDKSAIIAGLSNSAAALAAAMKQKEMSAGELV